MRSSGGGIKSQASAFVIKATENKLYWSDINAIDYPGSSEQGVVDSGSVDLTITGVSLDQTTSVNWYAKGDPKGWIDKRTLSAGGQQLVISTQFADAVSELPIINRSLGDKQAVVIALAEVPLDTISREWSCHRQHCFP